MSALNDTVTNDFYNEVLNRVYKNYKDGGDRVLLSTTANKGHKLEFYAAIDKLLNDGFQAAGWEYGRSNKFRLFVLLDRG